MEPYLPSTRPTSPTSAKPALNASPVPFDPLIAQAAFLHSYSAIIPVLVCVLRTNSFKMVFVYIAILVATSAILAMRAYAMCALQVTSDRALVV